MKKIFIGISVIVMSLASSVSSASMSYECWAYVGGSPDKMVHVSADNKSQAVNRAKDKMRNLGIRYDYVKCK